MLASLPTLSASDAEAIAASLTAPSAFSAVFERHFDVIHRFLRARVGAALAEELATETFVRAFSARDRYDLAYADARPWLFAIATNLVRGQHRAEARRLAAYARGGRRRRTVGR
jgi:RNA polymerase sigma-70 factor (ECF subfamily)